MLPKWLVLLGGRRLLSLVALLTHLAPVQPLEGEEHQQRDEDKQHLVPAALMGEHDGQGGHRHNRTGWLLVNLTSARRHFAVSH